MTRVVIPGSRLRLLTGWLAALLCLGGAADAASLQVAPTALRIDPAQGAAGLTLSNSGRAVIQAQVRVFRWSQHSGRDVLEPADALVASPPMLQLAPGASQLIRIVHTGDAPAMGDEVTYRVIVDELPDTGAAAASAGLRFALRYSIPVFVGADAVPAGAAQLRTRIVEVEGQPHVAIHNVGTARAQLADLVLVSGNGARHALAPGLSGYVLAGQHRRWPLPPGIDTAGATFDVLLNGEPGRRALAPDG